MSHSSHTMGPLQYLFLTRRGRIDRLTSFATRVRTRKEVDRRQTLRRPLPTNDRPSHDGRYEVPNP